MPRFKKRGTGDSFRYPQGFKINGNQVFLPKLGWFRFRKSRNIEGVIKNITVSYYVDSWYISIQVEKEIGTPVHRSTSMVGLDLGISRFVTLSNGQFYKPKNSFRKLEANLAKAQRCLSRKEKFSNNWKKQKLRIQKIHAKITNTRRDYLHWHSNKISKNHAMIVMENLQVSNMSKSAKGDMDNPGRNVKPKSDLNKSILEKGWYEFRRQLTYKQQWRGGQVIFVHPKNTSITCLNKKCCHISKTNRISQSEFVCEKCDFKANADVVGAVNVLRAGHAQLACGDIKSISFQAQESPTVAA